PERVGASGQARRPVRVELDGQVLEAHPRGAPLRPAAGGGGRPPASPAACRRRPPEGKAAPLCHTALRGQRGPLGGEDLVILAVGALCRRDPAAAVLLAGALAARALGSEVLELVVEILGHPVRDGRLPEVQGPARRDLVLPPDL